MKIPFWVYPFSWGLRGYDRKVALAKFYLSGYELETELLDIKRQSGELSKDDHMLGQLNIEFKHGKVTEYERDIDIARITLSGKELDIKELDIELAHNRISEKDHARRLCDINEERWVDVSVEVDSKSPKYGQFTFEWNTHMINFLHDNGYVSPSDDETIDMWFMDVCRGVVLNDIGNTAEEIDKIQESVVIKSKKVGGNTEYK